MDNDNDKTKRKPARTPKDRSIKTSLLPAHIQPIKDLDVQRRLYIQDLIFRLHSQTTILDMVAHTFGMDRRKARLVYESVLNDMQSVIKHRDDELVRIYFEQVVLYATRVALETKDFSSVFKGFAILKDIYGISKRHKIDVSSTTDKTPLESLFGSSFFNAKAESASNVVDGIPADTNDDDTKDVDGK